MTWGPGPCITLTSRGWQGRPAAIAMRYAKQRAMRRWHARHLHSSNGRDHLPGRVTSGRQLWLSPGTDDMIVPPVNAHRIGGRIPCTGRVRIPGAGHGLEYLFPDRSSDCVPGFSGPLNPRIGSLKNERWLNRFSTTALSCPVSRPTQPAGREIIPAMNSYPDESGSLFASPVLQNINGAPAVIHIPTSAARKYAIP